MKLTKTAMMSAGYWVSSYSPAACSGKPLLWQPGQRRRCSTDLFSFLVGNKNDDPERKVVETEDAYKFAGQMGIQLFETSAKENINVEEVIP